MSATIEFVEARPVDVRTGCICSNHGQPIEGVIYVNPCCRVHYAETRIPLASVEQGLSNQEKADWHLPETRVPAKKRVAYPKMTVARR